MKIIAVVPAYNESQTIAEVVRSLKSRVDEVIVVDDGSHDNTGTVARREGACVLRHFLNRGQGATLKTGIVYALFQGADCIVTFDADGQHDIEDIEAVIKPILKKEADVVLGTRFHKTHNLEPITQQKVPSFKFQVSREGIPILRFLILKLAVLFTKMTTGLTISDTHNGFRAFSRRSAENISITQDGMAHASEILEEIAKYKLRYTEVPVSIRYTPYSKSKGQSIFGVFKILRDLIIGKMYK